MSRKHTILLLLGSLGLTSENHLMDFLQYLGLVSDNSITLSDVPTGDLSYAIQKL